MTEDFSPAEKRSLLLEIVADGLRQGRKVSDADFDQVYPPAIRKLSLPHWTPVEVAVRAAELLVSPDHRRILDVGSGAGKFGIVGALTTGGHFTGIEQRPHLVTVARQAALELDAAESTHFLVGNMADLDWSDFDSFYLFNPFYENQDRKIRMDDTISFNLSKFNRYVETVRAKLAEARTGTRVATYFGFGGEMPERYRLIARERAGWQFLEVYQKI